MHGVELVDNYVLILEDDKEGSGTVKNQSSMFADESDVTYTFTTQPK